VVDRSLAGGDTAGDGSGGGPTRGPGRCRGTGTLAPMPTIRLFAGAREAAGTDRDAIDGATVGAVLDAAVDRFGSDFASLLPSCKVWVNGEPAERGDTVESTDEVAVLPPVSGGS
jgi:molybdopterin synthase sulfur carrier subunit